MFVSLPNANTQAKCFHLNGSLFQSHVRHEYLLRFSALFIHCDIV